MLENKEQEKIAGIISNFFDGTVNEADIDILAMKIYEKYVAELEQELAELKEKAIVPKFKVGQDIFFIDTEYQITQGVVDFILAGQDGFEKWCKYSIDLGLEYEDDIRFVDKDEEEIFATKQEAQEKLKEIQGNENYFNGKGTIGFICDVCGRKLNGCSIVNGMKFCAKCYQETFGKDNQQNEIQQLKQQLEEKDEQIKKRVMVYEKQFIEQTDEIYSLKQQLAEKQNTIDEINKEFVQAVHDWKTLCAEKDKEIERLKNLFELNNEVVINQGKEIFDLRVQVLQQKQNQTQIAIQELEKVKKRLLEESKRYPIVYDITDDLVGGAIDMDKTFEIIDNQIKILENL